MAFKYLGDWQKTESLPIEKAALIAQWEIAHQLDRIADALERRNSDEDFRDTVKLYKPAD